MNKTICLLFALAVINNCISQKKVSMGLDNQLTATEKSSGWKLLFDGKTTDGWHSYGRNDVSADWKITDGAIMLEPDKNIKDRKGYDLVTNNEYKNFDLKLD